MKDDGRTDGPAAQVPKDCWKTVEEQQEKERGRGNNEPAAPTSALWWMNSKWTGNSFLLGSSSLANQGG
jgi:hypothetical protein